MTNSSGRAETTSHPPGIYKGCETPQAGWTHSVPAQLDPVLNLPCHTVTVSPGQQAVLLFGNTQGAITQPADEIVLAGAVRISTPEDIDEEASADELSEFVFLPLVNREKWQGRRKALPQKKRRAMFALRFFCGNAKADNGQC